MQTRARTHNPLVTAHRRLPRVCSCPHQTFWYFPLCLLPSGALGLAAATVWTARQLRTLSPAVRPAARILPGARSVPNLLLARGKRAAWMVRPVQPHTWQVSPRRQSPPHETPRLLQNQYCVSHVRPAPPPSRADQACAPAAPLKAQLGLTVTRGGGGRAGHAFPGPPHAGWSGGCHSFLGQGWTLSGPQGCAGGPRTAGHTHTPLCASISCFPMASVTKAVPFRMMSVMVLHALGDSLSVGEMKLPAALLITICRGTRGYRDFEVRRHVRPRGRFCPKPRRGPIRDDARRVNTWPLSSSPLQSPMFLPNSSPSSFLKIRVESIKENRNRRSMPATRRHFTCL